MPFVNTPESRARMSKALKGKTPWNKLKEPRINCKDCGVDISSIPNIAKRPQCRPCRNSYERERYNPVRDRIRHLKYWYGVEEGWYEAIYKEQKGCCAICGERKEVLCIDHNHDTGEVRKLLCQHCNIIVGKIEHPLYAKALKYVENYHGKK